MIIKLAIMLAPIIPNLADNPKTVFNAPKPIMYKRAITIPPINPEIAPTTAPSFSSILS